MDTFVFSLMLWVMVALIIILVVVIFFSLYFTVCFQYWKKRNVPFLEPSIPFGNLGCSFLGKMSVGMNIANIYKNMEDNRLIGIYALSSPVVVLKDPALIHTVLETEFETFRDRGVYLEESEFLGRQLLCLSGCLWKRMRLKLAPAFSDAKLQAMYPTLDTCGRELSEALDAVASRPDPVDVHDLATRFAADVIASAAFGVEPKCLRNPDSEFLERARQVVGTSAISMPMIAALFISPALVKILKYFNGRNAADEYFLEMAKNAVSSRQENQVVRSDFLQLLIRMRFVGTLDDKDAGAIHWKLPLEDLAAQAFSFVLMGLETTSAALSFALLELALNPDIQRRLQEEVDSAFRVGLTFDSITDMDYLDKVVSETLRKYPPVPVLNRASACPYAVPGSGAVFEAGTPVMVSVLGLHHDPRHFPEPQRFDPGRFSGGRAARHPAAYLPFGTGPRSCVGSLFALLQIKIGLVYILSNFNVDTCEKTEEVLHFKPNSFTMLPNNGIYLRLSKRFE